MPRNHRTMSNNATFHPLIRMLIVGAIGCVLLAGCNSTKNATNTSSNNGDPNGSKVTITNVTMPLNNEYIAVTIQYMVDRISQEDAPSDNLHVSCSISGPGLNRNLASNENASLGPAKQPIVINVPKNTKGMLNITCVLQNNGKPVGIPSTDSITLASAPSVCTFCSTCSSGQPIQQIGGPAAVLATEDCTPTPTTPTDTPTPIDTPTPTDTPTPAPTTPSYNFDQTFDQPQYLIHATGHGTVDGPVKDDFYTLYTQQPDAQGVYRVPDGSGGTFTYGSDFHVGPLNTPRSVCQAAAARGLRPQTWTPYNRNDSFDCSLLSSSSTQSNDPAVPSVSQANVLITSYYDNKGVFAGKYVLKQIDSTTLGPQNGNQFSACAAYEYANPSTANVSVGTDKRTFLFQYLSSNWQVVSMGGYLSC